jgi:hypothetical protein
LRWACEDNQRYTGAVNCQVAYGDDGTKAMEHLYGPDKILGFVCPAPVYWIRDRDTVKFSWLCGNADCVRRKVRFLTCGSLSLSKNYYAGSPGMLILPHPCVVVFFA